MGLPECAALIANLNPRNEEETGLITFALGAVCCAVKAEQLGFTSQRDPDHWKDRRSEVLKIAQSLGAGGPLPHDGEWLANVYFNSALFRIDVAFERIARYVTQLNGHEGFQELLKRANKRGLSTSLLAPWAKVRNDVNALKHRNPEALKRPTISPPELVDALDCLIRSVDWALKYKAP
jgi:hypothetical protein